jgi:hypothetical protein
MERKYKVLCPGGRSLSRDAYGAFICPISYCVPCPSSLNGDERLIFGTAADKRSFLAKDLRS